MAYHWEHIKGINGTTPYYTHITFAADAIVNPTLKIGTDESALTDCGLIVSTGAINSFTANNYLLSTTYFDKEKKSSIAYNDTALLYTTTGQHKFSGSGFIITNSTGGSLTFADNMQLNCDIKVGNSGDDSLIVLSASNGSCTAKYFNATSDKRAKDNLIAVSSGALEFIKGLQVYTFNYKNDSERTIGLIAQDLENKSFNQVNFVSNSTATGVNNDYMGIKEDKLIYVLLQAVQEQQKEIEHLMKQISNMEEKYGK